MSSVIPSSPLESFNSVPGYITRRPKFLLSPPPPPKHKQKAQPKPAQPPTPPYSRRAQLATPRSPLSPLESFLNLLDTPSPYNSINKKHDISSTSQLLNDLGYNIAIETFHAPPASTVPVTPRPTATKSAIAYNPHPSAKTIVLGMNILSRQHTNASSSSAKLVMPLHSRSNNSGYEAATSRPPIPPMMPDYSQQRRGSLPTSTSQNYPRSHSKSSSRENGAGPMMMMMNGEERLGRGNEGRIVWMRDGHEKRRKKVAEKDLLRVLLEHTQEPAALLLPALLTRPRASRARPRARPRGMQVGIPRIRSRLR